jgi:hypothetical protein
MIEKGNVNMWITSGAAASSQQADLHPRVDGSFVKHKQKKKKDQLNSSTSVVPPRRR